MLPVSVSSSSPRSLSSDLRKAENSFCASSTARPLADDIRRIDADIAATHATIAASTQAAADAALELERAGAAHTQAAAQLLEAENAQRAAAPLLDQAKALDARIEAMLPAYRQASAACEKADQADAAAKSAMQSKQDERVRLDAQHAAGVTWLGQHKQWQTLAQSWERWDVLFIQAGQAASQAEKLGNAAARIQRNAKAHRDEAADAGAKLATSSAVLQTLEARRQDAIQALATFSAEQLQATRSGWEQRRDLLAGAEKIWIELEARQQRSAQIAAQSAQQRQAMETAEKQLTAAQQENIAILAAFSQAERSLKLAEAACAENVESLRASLEDDTPCPVCGAHEHPYRHNDGPLQAMLGGLQAEVTRCRKQMEANVNQQAAQRATVQASLEQLQMLATESRGVQQALEKVAAAWSAHALVMGGGDGAAPLELPPEAGRTDWFTFELEAARAALQAAEQQERALHAARNARDQAQSAWDVASAEHARLQSVASGAQTALALANTEYKALEDQRIEVALTLSALLSDLDAAFSGGDIPSDEWKDDWKTGPARFHAARQAESKQWLAQRAAYDERGAAMATIDVELKALNLSLIHI